MTDAGSAPTDVPDPLDLPLRGLLDELGGEGGSFASGSAAAVVAAIAAEIVAAAARRSMGWDQARGAAAQAHALRLRIAPLAGSDARAWAEARKLLSGGGDDTGSERRDFRLGEALATAAKVPWMIAEAAADVAALARDVAEHGAPEVKGDAAGAAVLAHAAARTAAHLVEINLATTPDDARVISANASAAGAGAAAEAALALE